ncbi:MAG: hypothetical protein EAY76_06980 [Alphaproteobacteria bacterium]|jgi:hypothetical protein|nr:MAG: hypothetical protein EAY76_06980 [Alphaproteobacteria bacterium]
MSEPQTKKIKAQLTPKGVFKFPALTKPDTYKGATKYKTGLVLDPNNEEVAAFIQRLERIRDEHVEKVKKYLTDEGKPGLAKKVATREVFRNEEDKEGNDTGMIVLNAAMKSEYVDRKTGDVIPLFPKFFDAKGQKIKKAPEIWGGTVGRLGVDIMPTCREADKAWGVGLFLDAVFIVDLRGPAGRGASDYGYTGDEGGYSYDGDDDDTSSDYSAAGVPADDGEDDDF